MRQAERDIKQMMKNFTAAAKTTTQLINNTNASYERISSDATIVMENFKGETLETIQSNIATIQKNLETADFEQTQNNIKTTLEQWNTTYTEIEQAQKLFNLISKKLEKGESGSLAQILNDPRFYDGEKINIEDYTKLLQDIRNNPEKYTYLFYKEKE